MQWFKTLSAAEDLEVHGFPIWMPTTDGIIFWMAKRNLREIFCSSIRKVAGANRRQSPLRSRRAPLQTQPRREVVRPAVRARDLPGRRRTEIGRGAGRERR